MLAEPVIGVFGYVCGNALSELMRGCAQRETLKTVGSFGWWQCQLTDDINRVSDDAKPKLNHVPAAVVIADGRSCSLQQPNYRSARRLA